MDTNIQETAAEPTVYTPTAQENRKALSEFREWKQALQTMIRREASLKWQIGGRYSFVLPSRLVKLVWIATLKERIKLELSKGGTEEEATRRAMAQIQQEVATAVGKIKSYLPMPPMPQEVPVQDGEVSNGKG